VTPVRVVLAGLGVIGRQHLRLIEASVDFELVGVADPGPSAVTDLPDGVPGCDDFRAMIEETSPSAVIIAAPNQAHAEIALHCLERGIPVLIENQHCRATSYTLHWQVEALLLLLSTANLWARSAFTPN
jgi:predicted dehydrogenase